MQSTGTATVNTMHTNEEETERAKKDERKNLLKSLGDDASFLAKEMKIFGVLCKTADDAIAKRDECFSTKMKVPKFAEAVQRLRDWGSGKHNNEILIVNSKPYKSVKKLFKDELGVSYEFVVRYTAKEAKRIHSLLTMDDDQSQDAVADDPTPSNPTPTTPTTPTTPPTAQPKIEILSVNGVHTNSFPMAERVKSDLDFSLTLTRDLSATEKYEFHCEMIRQHQILADEAEEEMDALEEKI
jgi:hypothetical protein